MWSDANCTYETAGTQVATFLGFKCVIIRLLGIVVPIIILAAVGMIIYAGAKIIMGGENPKEYQAGMQTLAMAVVGLIGLGLAWVIILLIQSFTGANITDFNFTLPN